MTSVFDSATKSAKAQAHLILDPEPDIPQKFE